jgi:hypothetical protein
MLRFPGDVGDEEDWLTYLRQTPIPPPTDGVPLPWAACLTSSYSITYAPQCPCVFAINVNVMYITLGRLPARVRCLVFGNGLVLIIANVYDGNAGIFPVYLL